MSDPTNDLQEAGQVAGSETRPEAGEGTVSVGKIKRLLAALGAVVVIIVVGVFLFLISFAIRETGDGANPDRAFSSTDLDPDALLAEISWLPDTENLVRRMEPSTREAIGVAWLRADDALTRAALGDTSGLDVWFVDPALANATARFTPQPGGDVMVRTAASTAHQLRIDFYSLDGQVIVLTIDTTGNHTNGTTSTADTAATTERREVVLVLSDGNWRIRHLERLTDTNLSIQIES